jgi:hypothetical protein
MVVMVDLAEKTIVGMERMSKKGRMSGELATGLDKVLAGMVSVTL